MNHAAPLRPNVFVGNPVERVEDLRLLRGEGCFIADFDLPGLWHAAVLRSSVAHGRIVRLDAAAALALPGVHAVVTAADIGTPLPTIPFRRPNPTIGPYAQPVIAAGRVRYVGEPVALVLADSAEIAEDAAGLIELDIEPLPPIATAGAARDLPPMFEPTPGNCASVYTCETGDVDAAFVGAAHIVRGRFGVQRQTALPMETRGLVAHWDAERGHLTMSGAAKLPFFNRRAMAGMMGLQPADVDYIELDVGGGFGARGEFYPEDFLVAFAARRFGHPVKWIEDRREHLTAIAHCREMVANLELALAPDGTILGVRGEIDVDLGAYVRPNGMTPVRNVAQFVTGPYRVADLRLAAGGWVTNKTPAGTYRGPGRYEGCFFMERLLDKAARQCGFEPLELRRRNLLRAAEMPHPVAAVLPEDGFGETEYDSGDYWTTFERCLAEAGWADKVALQGRLIDGRYHGLGVACFVEGGGSGPRETARMTVRTDGVVDVSVGSSAIGQGLETVFSQIAADALEVPMERICVRHGSTNLLADGLGSYGSRATVMGGSAVLVTAGLLRDRLREMGLTLETGAGVSVDGEFAGHKQTYTFGCAVAHVAVDAATGHVRLLDYHVVDDVGRAINPATLHGQVIGATVQGLGTTFTEELVYDQDAQLLVGSLADYLLPTASDFPSLHALTLENYPSPNNPLGVKGAGEGGIIPVGAAVANAVAAALADFSVSPDQMPLSPSRIWGWLHASEEVG
jgi:carbon-monoxide dehydrogenase large subunit